MTSHRNLFDRAISAVAPQWGFRRTRARALTRALDMLSERADSRRAYEAAAIGGRATNWPSGSTDANTVIGAGSSIVRARCRVLVENNGWARAALGAIQSDVIGEGARAKAIGPSATEKFSAAWKAWSESTDCDSAGRCTLAAMESLCVRTMVESGEVLIRRRVRRDADGLALPLQLQVMEPDWLDASHDGYIGDYGGPVTQGIEFDAIGRRRGYWLYKQHPGSQTLNAMQSSFVPADEVVHLYRLDRPGQDRGISWFATAIPTLRELDDFEDASLVKQRVAACLAAFVTDDGLSGDSGDGASAIGGTVSTDNSLTELYPGMIKALAPGRKIEVVNPPNAMDDGFSVRHLQKIAAALEIPYESMVGDWSRVNYSSARMARLRYWSRVWQWRYHVVQPLMLMPIWRWAVEGGIMSRMLAGEPDVSWTFPAPALLEPDKEAMANIRAVRGGMKTPSEVVREQGYDPDDFFREMAADLEMLDKLGIVLDSDARKVTQAGLGQPNPIVPGLVGGGQPGVAT